MIKFPRLENFLFINEFEPDSARHLGEEMLASVYLGLEPLSELHGDVHVGQTESAVVHAVAVHRLADLVPDHVLAALLLGQADGGGPGAGLAPGGGPAADAQPGV